MNKNIGRTIITASVCMSFFGLAGCKTDEINCVVNGKKPESCNLYTAKATVDSPLEDKVVIIGDSLWDYGKPHGAIPLKLIELSGKTYYELARSGAFTSYILDDEIPKIPKEDNVYALKSVLVNGGANNVRTPCEIDLENNVNVTAETFSQSCNDAIAEAEIGAEQIIGRLVAIPSVDHVVWVGPQYFPIEKVSAELVDFVSDRISTLCAAESKCHFVDLRGIWSQSNADAYLFDKEHVNQDGAELVGNEIWQKMESIGAYR